jgi:PAS domain S-box-containing protein
MDTIVPTSSAGAGQPGDRTLQAPSDGDAVYRALFETSPLPKWVYDQETLAILAVNEAAVRHYGYTRAEFLAMTIKDIRPLEDVPRLLDSIANSPRGSPAEAGLWRHRRKDGSEITVEIYGHQVIFNGRDARLILAIDITERLQTDQALRDSESRYRMLLDQASDAILITDHEGRYLDANTQACLMFGYSREELLGMNAGQMVVYETIETMRQQWLGMSPGQSLMREHWVCRKDGRIIPVEANVKRLPDGRLQAIIRDISERKGAEQALSESNARLTVLTQQLSRSRDLLRTLFDGLDDGLVLLDRDGQILATNQAFAAMLRTQPRELTEQNWCDLCHGDNPFPGTCAIQALHDGRARQRREQYTQPDGRLRVLDLRALPLNTNSGQVDQVIVHVADSTERLSLEALALQSERLAATGKLAATIAHELNTPLQSITNCLYFAENAAEPQRNKYLTLAREELARVAVILRQMLDLHRPGTSQPALFDLNALVERVLLLTGSTLAEQDIDVVCELDRSLPELHGRADHLTQVLLNLILNAVDAMPEGGRLLIRTSTLPAPEQRLVLEIEDDGVGIPPEHQGHLFEPFFTTKPAGSGLGLAVSHKLISQHGGTISVRSAPGAGSLFRVELPQHATSAEVQV